MDKSHAVCKECVVEHYWHHMDDQKCFFEVMIGDFRNEVVIPKEFAMNIRGLISDEVKLEAPNGKTYDVKVVKEQNDLVIGSGWATFARAYGINQGDFLVFTYSGHSHLKVRIFNSTGCEKELSCVLIDGIPCVQERHVSHGNHTQSPTSKRLAKVCIGSSSDRRKSSKTSPTGTPSQKTAADVPTSEGIQEPMNSGGFQESTKSCIVLPMGCNLTSQQKAKITTLEQKIQPKIPLYITAMDKASVAGGFLAIRKNYAVKHLSDNTGTITLSQLYSSKTWDINLNMSTDGLYGLSSGWLNFIRKRGVTWIFHPLEERCPPEPPGFVGSIKNPRHRVMLPRFTTLNDQQKNKVNETI